MMPCYSFLIVMLRFRDKFIKIFHLSCPDFSMMSLSRFCVSGADGSDESRGDRFSLVRKFSFTTIDNRHSSFAVFRFCESDDYGQLVMTYGCEGGIYFKNKTQRR